LRGPWFDPNQVAPASLIAYSILQIYGTVFPTNSWLSILTDKATQIPSWGRELWRICRR